MYELDLITFVGILEYWHVFDKSRFNTSFSISGFEVMLSLNYLFMLLILLAMILGWFLCCSIDLAIGSSLWPISTDLSWYFGISRFGTTLIKIIKNLCKPSLFQKRED